MKAICTIKAFYNGKIIKPGEEVNIKGKKLPSWAKAVKEIAPEEVNEEGVNDNEAPVEETPVEETPVEEAPEEVVEPDQPFQEDTPEGVNEGEEVPFDVEEAPEGVNEGVNDEEDDLTNKTEVELSAILDDLLTQALDKGIEIEIGTKPIIDSIIELRQKLEGVNK